MLLVNSGPLQGFKKLLHFCRNDLFAIHAEVCGRAPYYQEGLCYYGESIGAVSHFRMDDGMPQFAWNYITGKGRETSGDEEYQSSCLAREVVLRVSQDRQ